MRFNRAWLLGLSVILLSSCNEIETDRQKLSYTKGFEAGQALKAEGIDPDTQAYLLGLQDALKEGQGDFRPRLSPQDMDQARERREKDLVKAKNLRLDENRNRSLSYLESHKNLPGVMTTNSGLQYQMLQKGTGPQAKATDQVKVRFQGKLVNGEVFDQSPEGGEPMVVSLKSNMPAWVEALQLMNTGSKIRIVVPPELGFAHQRRGKVPPFSTLIYEIELVEILPGHRRR